MKRGPNDRKVVIPIAKESEMESFYLQEAREQGMGLPTLFYNLLEDRFKAMRGKSSGLWFPRTIASVGVTQSDTTVPASTNDDAKTSPELAFKMFGQEDD